MKILVLGTSGFIGLPVAQALVRAGHYVIGVTESQESAKRLAAEEIVPLIAEIGKPAAWVNIVKDLDAVIECVRGKVDQKKLSEEILTAVSTAAREHRPQGSPKLTYIFTSGTWVHGDNRNEIVTDTTPIRSPIDMVTWRADREQMVINDPVLNGFVIRPGFLHGGSSPLLAPFFQAASEGSVWFPGTPGGRLAQIHTDDLANLFVKATEKAAICGGLAIDAVNEYTESVDDLLAVLVKVSGAKAPYEYRVPANLHEGALGTTSLIRPYLAKALLGWHPSKPSLVDGLPVYYAAWVASR